MNRAFNSILLLITLLLSTQLKAWELYDEKRMISTSWLVPTRILVTLMTTKAPPF